MYRDCLGNTYSSLPGRPPVHSAKATKSDKTGRKGRSKRAGEWRQKVHGREARHRAAGQRFTVYPC